MNLHDILISIWLLCGLACAIWLQHWVRQNHFTYRPAPIGLLGRAIDWVLPLMAGPIGLILAGRRVYVGKRRRERMKRAD